MPTIRNNLLPQSSLQNGTCACLIVVFQHASSSILNIFLWDNNHKFYTAIFWHHPITDQTPLTNTYQHSRLVQRWNYWPVFRVTNSIEISSRKRFCIFFVIFLSSKANAKNYNKSAWWKSSATGPLSKTYLPVGQLSRCSPILQSEHGRRFSSWNAVLFSLYLTMDKNLAKTDQSEDICAGGNTKVNLTWIRKEGRNWTDLAQDSGSGELLRTH